jgi:hypothetical protein
LNWSVISRFPGVLNGPPDKPDEEVCVLEAVLDEAVCELAVVEPVLLEPPFSKL